LAKPGRLPRRLALPAEHRGASCIVAYSGGADSTALLLLAAESGLADLRAVHVHHGLQAAADDWAAHCETVCARLGVPLSVHRVQIAADDPAGPEAAARQARYAVLREQLPPGGLLLTAHHRGDQAETVLLRLLRGSGVEGLGAIRPLTAFGAGWLWRPLLDQPADALRALVGSRGLRWIEDPHNRSSRYARSWLRAELMPPLRERWPDAEAQLAAAAARCAEAAELLQDMAADLLPGLRREDGGLSVSGLLGLSTARRRLVLRHWLAERALPPPYEETLRHLDREVLSARADAEPLLRWPGGEFRRHRDGLYAAQPLPALPSEYSIAWDGRSDLRLPPGCGVLRAGMPVRARVRLPRGGERLRLAGARHHRSLRALAQQHGLPPWVRERLALIEVDGELASIAGRWNADPVSRIGGALQVWSGVAPPGLPLSWRQI